MHKNKVILLLLLLGLSLSGCKKDLYTVKLFNGEEEVEVFENVSSGTIINLPIIDVEGNVFVGWRSNENIYNNEFKVVKNIELKAEFEEVSDVFNYIENNHYDIDGNIVDDNEYPSITITGYTGITTYLKIPQIINGKIVSNIANNAFEDSTLVEVQLPQDAYVGRDAFLNSIELEKVTFHGDYIIPYYRIIGQVEYYEIMNEYPDCIVTEGIEGEVSWKFQDGCPIMEVRSISFHTSMDGTLYHNYEVIINKNFDSSSGSTSFAEYAFRGATSLETIEVNKLDMYLFSSSFEGCKSLKYIIVDSDSKNFTVENGVLYNKNMTALILYPGGLTDTEFVIPLSVKGVMFDGFDSNDHVETLYVHSEFTGTIGLMENSSVKEIIVDENNEEYYSIDGVLYSENTLVRYPPAKTDVYFELPDGINTLASFSFSSTKFLVTIDFGDELISILDRAFNNSEKITILDIPSSCEYIGYFIGSGSNINTIIINRSIIVNESITILISPIEYFTENNITFYVSDDSIETYKTTDYWLNFADVMKPISEYQD